MKEKRLENLEFEFDGTDYTIGFTINEAKELSQYSLQRGSDMTDAQFLKFGLKKFSDDIYITDKRAKEIQEALFEHGLDTVELGHLSYEEVIGYMISLFGQTIDDEAGKVEPALIVINKDNSLDVTVGDKTYTLKFTREIIEETARTENGFRFGNVFDLYAWGSSLVEVALRHYKKRFSLKLREQIFLAMWATTLDEDIENNLAEALNALLFHMNEVVESGTKKSLKPTLKAKN